MQNSIGNALIAFGGIVLVVSGLWSFVLDLAILVDAMGFPGAVLGLLFLPVTLVAAPWYAGVAYGNWFPLLLGYGGGGLAWLLLMIGMAVGDDRG